MAKRKGLDKQFPVVVGVLSWAGEYLTPIGIDPVLASNATYQALLKEKKEALKNA